MLPLHGIGGRGDLPVPLWLAVYAAGAAVAVSFFALAAFWSRPRFEVSRGRALPVSVDRPAVRLLLKAIGLLALVVLLGVAWFGNKSPARNPAPTWLYVWIWVGIIPLSLLFGPIWRLANPVRTLAGGIRTLLRKPEGFASLRWEYLPAFVGLAAFVWLELAFPESSDPRLVAVFVTAYVLCNVVVAVVFGPRVSDGFEAYAELLTRLSPWSRGPGGELVIRNPMAGLATVPRSNGVAALLCLLLGSTAFDGISRWSFWSVATGNLDPIARTLVNTLGLAAAVALVTCAFVLAARGTGAPVGMPAAFAHSLVPISIGYAVAHYFSFAVFQGQAGWGLFGSGEIDYGVASTGLIAAVQIGAIVLGHVIAVVAAHDRATALFRRRQLRRAQYPMLAAMVAFTAGGIALVTGS